jgi:hypothetical protein
LAGNCPFPAKSFLFFVQQHHKTLTTTTTKFHHEPTFFYCQRQHSRSPAGANITVRTARHDPAICSAFVSPISLSRSLSLLSLLTPHVSCICHSYSEDPTVSLSAFSYLYSEMVQYHENRVDSIVEQNRRLEQTGYSVGLRVLELLACVKRDFKRETRLMNILQFVSTTVWKYLFGKPADSLERSMDHVDEFMIFDYSVLTSHYLTVPAAYAGSLSAEAYISGIIAGILDGAGFSARVTAHTVALEEGECAPAVTMSAPVIGSANITTPATGRNPLLPARKDKAVFLVKFDPSVLTRDANMN